MKFLIPLKPTFYFWETTYIFSKSWPLDLWQASEMNCIPAYVLILLFTFSVFASQVILLLWRHSNLFSVSTNKVFKHLLILVFQFSLLFLVDCVEKLDLLTVATCLTPLAPAVLPMCLHRIWDVYVEAISIRAGARDQQRVWSCFSQLTRYKAVFTARVAQRWGACMCRWLADVGHNRNTVHGFLIVTDLQNLQMDLHIGVGHPSTTPVARVRLFRAGLMAHRFGAVNLNLLGVVGGNSEAITAHLIGGEGQCFACGCLEGHGALEGTKRDRQSTCRSLLSRSKNYKTKPDITKGCFWSLADRKTHRIYLLL